MKKSIFVKKRIYLFLLITLSSFVFFETVSAQNVTLESLLKSNKYILEKNNNRLTGNGKDFLLSAAKDAQFFAFGEEHFVKEIPEIVTMLFEDLHQTYGFNFLALESDPISAGWISKKPYLGNRSGIFELTQKYPNAFTFNTDQEIEMIYQAGKISTGKGDRIWGLDQVFGGLHVLKRLVELAPNKMVKEKTQQLLEHAQKYDSERRTGERFYMTPSVPKPDDFKNIKQWYQPPAGSEAEFLIDQLLLSERVFRTNASTSENSVPTVYESNREREENMKSLFMREYKYAQEKGESVPKVLLKFGQIHLTRGLSSLKIPSFGNFVSEFAKSNGLKSFHLYSYTHNAPGGFRAIGEKSWLKPFANIADLDKWTIFDLRPLRPYVYSKKIEVSASLENIIFSYDAILLIGGASPSSSNETLGSSN